MKNINWIDHILNFVSVILGVSLAFYVSNWSETNKKNEESIQIIESLIQELERDIGFYDNIQIERNRLQATKLENAIRQIRNNKLDSLPKILQRGIGYSNYYPQKVTFKSITTSGKLALINDYSLQIQIASFYEASAVEAKFRGESQVDFYKKYFVPLLIEGTDLLNPNIAEIDIEKVTNLLLLYKNIIEWKVRQYEALAKEGKALQDSLRAYKARL